VVLFHPSPLAMGILATGNGVSTLHDVGLPYWDPRCLNSTRSDCPREPMESTMSEGNSLTRTHLALAIIAIHSTVSRSATTVTKIT
jgi:hypothetical protein